MLELVIFKEDKFWMDSDKINGVTVKASHLGWLGSEFKAVHIDVLLGRLLGFCWLHYQGII